MAQRKQVIGFRSYNSHSWAASQMKATVRSVRRQTRDALKKGEYDRAKDVIISVGYLD